MVGTTEIGRMRAAAVLRHRATASIAASVRAQRRLFAPLALVVLTPTTPSCSWSLVEGLPASPYRRRERPRRRRQLCRRRRWWRRRRRSRAVGRLLQLRRVYVGEAVFSRLSLSSRRTDADDALVQLVIGRRIARKAVPEARTPEAAAPSLQAQEVAVLAAAVAVVAPAEGATSAEKVSRLVFTELRALLTGKYAK